MKKTITIDGKKAFKINTSNRWLRIYRDNFGHDILPDMVPVIDTGLGLIAGIVNGGNIDLDEIESNFYALEMVTINNVIWALAKNADDSIPDVEEWEDQFDKWTYDELVPQIIETLAQTYITEKKLKLLKAGLEERHSQLTKSLSQELTED